VELGERAEALGKRKAIPFDLKALAIAGCLQDVAGEGEVLTDRL
jgi:hypothetical protein